MDELLGDPSIAAVASESSNVESLAQTLALVEAGKCLVRGELANLRALMTALTRPGVSWRPAP